VVHAGTPAGGAAEAVSKRRRNGSRDAFRLNRAPRFGKQYTVEGSDRMVNETVKSDVWWVVCWGGGPESSYRA
jgi:hypothetical protein